MSTNKMKMMITIEDFQEQHRPYAEVIGVDNLILMAQNFGGSSIYIPKVEELLKNRKYAQIIGEYDGSNIKRLAVKYNVSESTVYRLVKDRIIALRSKPLEGQLKLF